MCRLLSLKTKQVLLYDMIYNVPSATAGRKSNLL